MQEILNNIIENTSGNPMYLILGAILGLFFIIMILKKLFKVAMIIFVLALVYIGYLYVTDADAAKKIKENLEKGKSAIESIDEATEDVRDEATDKIINELEKKRKDVEKQVKSN